MEGRYSRAETPGGSGNSGCVSSSTDPEGGGRSGGGDVGTVTDGTGTSGSSDANVVVLAGQMGLRGRHRGSAGVPVEAGNGTWSRILSLRMLLRVCWSPDDAV